MHVIAAKAVSFKEAMSQEFVLYQQQVVKNSQALGAALLEYGFDLVSGGSDNHLLLVDLTNKNITGQEAEETLESAGLTVNKNAIPFDTKSRFVTGGIRIGTPAVTSRGLKEEDMNQIAAWINRVIDKFRKWAGNKQDPFRGEGNCVKDSRSILIFMLMTNS